MSTKEKSVRVIIKEPKKIAVIRTIGNDLETLQGIVGGLIDIVEDNGIDIIVNDEGLLIGLEPNFFLKQLVLGHRQLICGTAIFACHDEEGGMVSIPEDRVLSVLGRVNAIEQATGEENPEDYIFCKFIPL